MDFESILLALLLRSSEPLLLSAGFVLPSTAECGELPSYEVLSGSLSDDLVQCLTPTGLL